MFAEESWYRERPEPEVRREGVLAPHPHAVGPGSRGGLDFTLRGAHGVDLVYAAGVEDRLARFVGLPLVAHGKLVDVNGVVELWIGRIESAR